MAANSILQKIFITPFDLKIIWIRIDSDDDAYSIFEIVNARGADLTAADLIKNYLFKEIPKNNEGIDDAKDKWQIIENNIENDQGSITLSKFIRYYWLSKFSFVQEKRLYKEIKRTISNPSRNTEVNTKTNKPFCSSFSTVSLIFCKSRVL